MAPTPNYALKLIKFGKVVAICPPAAINEPTTLNPIRASGWAALGFRFRAGHTFEIQILNPTRASGWAALGFRFRADGSKRDGQYYRL